MTQHKILQTVFCEGVFLKNLAKFTHAKIHAEMLHRHEEINYTQRKSIFLVTGLCKLGYRQHFVILITEMITVTWFTSCNNQTRLCILFITCINVHVFGGKFSNLEPQK